MLTPNDLIVHSLTVSKTMLNGFCKDLTSTQLLHRPASGCNCAAWLLGHLALTERTVLAKRFAVTDLPELPDGFEKRFSRDEGCPQASDFGDTAVLLPLFNQTRDALIAAVQSASLADLDKPIEPPHPRFKYLGELTSFMALHSILHAGQISTIRRSLGLPPLI